MKRIPLNPKSTQLNKTIIREVQLISRLNHENVVRYAFNEISTDGVLVYAEIVRTDSQQTLVGQVNISFSTTVFQIARFKYFTSRKEGRGS